LTTVIFGKTGPQNCVTGTHRSSTTTRNAMFVTHQC